MLTLISPAKKLLQFSSPYLRATTKPIFLKRTDELIQIMKQCSSSDLAHLMHLSSELAELNYQRYQAFLYGNPPVSYGYPAALLFQGDVYQNLRADLWSEESINYSQSHLVILSGLYGLLKPFDVIQPYRLEMGTKIKNPYGNNLYDFWQTLVTQELNKRLACDTNPILINLASIEYFKVVKMPLLKAPLLNIHFQEQKNNQLKVIGVEAKKARGAMANYIMQNQISKVDKIKDFTLLNYQFCEKSSDENNYNFIRTK